MANGEKRQRKHTRRKHIKWTNKIVIMFPFIALSLVFLDTTPPLPYPPLPSPPHLVALALTHALPIPLPSRVILLPFIGYMICPR